MSKTAHMAVWAQDPHSYDIIPPSFTVFRNPDLRRVEARHIFVLASAADLSAISAFVRVPYHRSHLRALFVREDGNAQFLPQLLDQAELRIRRNILVHSDQEVPKRVLRAWSLGCPAELIATAKVTHDELFVVACDHSLLRVHFEEMAALRGISPQHRSAFTISSEGSYLHWPKADVHIDLDAVRYLKDDAWREKKERERLLYDTRFGEAVAALRKRHGIKQAGIHGLSERQVRRIERGKRTRIDTLAIVARSHGLSLKEYLNEIAGMLSMED